MVKDFLPNSGLTLRFASIDPTTELLDLMIAKTSLESVEFPVDIALDAPRDDFIVLEAIEFPGINLFWLGSSLMMLGMALSMTRRWRKI
jgi:cytochrome c-type biogenesis protein CcmF